MVVPNAFLARLTAMKPFKAHYSQTNILFLFFYQRELEVIRYDI